MRVDETQQVRPVLVEIKNWADAWAKPKLVAHTTLRTHIVDPASTSARYVQIASEEPRRIRTIIQVIDAAVTLTTEPPVTSPDTSVAAGPAPQGRYLPVSTMEYVFFGPDALWINSLSAVTRVTVTKEYC